MTSLTQRAARASLWSALEIAARYGVHFIVTMVLARLLPPSDFGLMAMLLVFTILAALLTDGSFGTALVQKQDASTDDETSVFLVSLSIGIVLSGFLLLLAPSIATFYGQPRLVSLLYLLVWVLPLGAIIAVPNAVLARQLDFRKRAKIECTSSLLSGILALGLAVHGYGVWSLVWQAVAGAGLRALLLWLLSGWRPRGRFDRYAFSRLCRFSGPLLLANFLSLASTRLQSLVIGHQFDARYLGFYTLAQDTQQAPAQFMTNLLNRVGLPIFSAVAEQPTKLASALRLSLSLSMFVFAPCMIGIAVVARPLVTTLYGEIWAPSAPLLSVLTLATVFWPVHILNLAAISARGRTDLILRLELIKTLLLAPALVIAGFFGVMAVAWVTLGANLASVAINTWYSRKLLNFGFRAQAREVVPTLLHSSVAAGGAWLVVTHTTQYPTIYGLIVAVATAIIIYITGAALLKPRAWKDILALMDTLRHKRVNNYKGGMP